MSMAISDLPKEILIQIFSLLPPKSVGICRCLAKKWHTLLSTPEFLESHFTRKPHQETLILITPPSRLIAATKDGGTSTDLDLPIRTCWVDGSCGGLVLLTNTDYDKFLVNPVTLEYVELPFSPIDLMRDFEFSMPGLGYDRLSNDYKVVTLSHYNNTDYDFGGTFVDVYSVNTGVWERRVCSSPYDHDVLYKLAGAFVNGALHWVANGPGRCVIAALDLVDRVFDEIPLPRALDDVDLLVVLGGCLCVIENESDVARADIWIMREYGERDSWARIIVHAGLDGDITKALCFINGNDEEEIVLLTDDDDDENRVEETLVVYNLRERTLRHMLVFVDGVPAACLDAAAFVESLVSPSTARGRL